MDRKVQIRKDKLLLFYENVSMQADGPCYVSDLWVLHTVIVPSALASALQRLSAINVISDFGTRIWKFIDLSYPAPHFFKSLKIRDSTETDKLIT